LASSSMLQPGSTAAAASGAMPGLTSSSMLHPSSTAAAGGGVLGYMLQQQGAAADVEGGGEPAAKQPKTGLHGPSSNRAAAGSSAAAGSAASLSHPALIELRRLWLKCQGVGLSAGNSAGNGSHQAE
jgi:hypothetical protein